MDADPGSKPPVPCGLKGRERGRKHRQNADPSPQRPPKSQRFRPGRETSQDDRLLGQNECLSGIQVSNLIHAIGPRVRTEAAFLQLHTR